VVDSPTSVYAAGVTGINKVTQMDIIQSVYLTALY
jgi:hypothetical protein